MKAPLFLLPCGRTASAPAPSVRGSAGGRPLASWAVALFVALVPACGDDGGDDSSADGSADGSEQDGEGGDGSHADGSGADGSGGIDELEASCQAYCEAQGELACPEDFPPAQCTDLCIGFPDTFGRCTEEWTNLNWCMAEAPLFCENGTTAVSYDDCPEQLDAFDLCVQSE